LSECFSLNDGDFRTQSEKFFKTLNGTFHQCFKKIRITNKSKKVNENDELQQNLMLKTKLQEFCSSAKSALAKSVADRKIKHLDKIISKLSSDRNAKIVKQQLGQLNDPNGSFSRNGMWKVKAKLLPRQRDPPTAKRDSQGNIITKTESLKQLYLDTYTNRLQPRVMKSEFKEIYHLKTKLWSERLKVIRLEITPCWKEAKLNKVIKSLKKNQTRDPNGMVNELFLPGVMGKDLESALIMLMNGVKSSFYIPHFLELADITSLFKMKGSCMDLVNDRGIFILSVIRKILDKLIYQDKYDDIAQGMSDSNIGAQKKKGIKNHLFVFGWMTV
jgi:hypothetical protein